MKNAENQGENKTRGLLCRLGHKRITQHLAENATLRRETVLISVKGLFER